MNVHEFPLFQCGMNLGGQTYQMVMYETSNMIDVFVKKRSQGCGFNQGRGVIGIINQTGSKALAAYQDGAFGGAAGSRDTGQWGDVNKAYRFIPAGTPVPVVLNWYKDNETVPFATGEEV